MDMNLNYLGFAGSAFSTLATLYFWLVRMRRERPSLRAYPADKEIFLGNGRDGVRQLGLKVGVIVANYSVLPNAILGARLSVRLHQDWQEVGHLAFDKQTPQPFNIPPLQSVLLRLTATLTFPYEDELEEGTKIVANYLNKFVRQPLEMRLDLRHLDNGVDTTVLTWAAENDTPVMGRAVRNSSAAA